MGNEGDYDNNIHNRTFFMVCFLYSTNVHTFTRLAIQTSLKSNTIYSHLTRMTILFYIDFFIKYSIITI